MPGPTLAAPVDLRVETLNVDHTIVVVGHIEVRGAEDRQRVVADALTVTWLPPRAASRASCWSWY